MYKIIGADQKEYGPISADQIRQWVSEGRVNGQTVACAEGTQDWKPLSEFPEFGFTATPAAAPLPEAATTAPVSLEEIAARDYSLDIMSCISRAWALFKDNFGSVFVTYLLLFGLAVGAGFVIQMIFAASGINHLPLVKQAYFRPIAALFSALVVGPALGGLFFVYLSNLRGQPATPGDLFIGFKSFQDLFLAKLIPALITTACTLPFTLATSAKIGPFFEHMKESKTPPDPHEMLSVFISSYTPSLPLLLIGMIPTTYLFVSLLFTVPLIIDRKIGFWSAFVMSWKIVHKHWFHVFGLVVLISLLNIAGVFVCCLGWLVTVPLGTLAICYAYEDIFGRKTA